VHKTDIDVAIIGAGPYALGLAQHLSHRGVERAVFGRPMQFWRDMPGGMFLKSFGFATSIATIDRSRTLPQYCRARSLEDEEPIAIQTFAEYGLEVQQALVPDVRETHVSRVVRDDRGFRLELEDGDECRARFVVVATGLTHCEVIGEPFDQLDAWLVSHTGQHKTFTPFAGREVVVIGAGQSALQAAALLREAGASVSLLAREQVHWHGKTPLKRSLISRIRNPNTGLGPGRDNWVLTQFPGIFPRLDEERRVRFTRRHLGPAGAWWLRHRVDGVVPVHEHTVVTGVREQAGRIVMTLSCNGSTRQLSADHAVAGTGYEPDVARLKFLSDDITAGIARTERAPRLSLRFESSVPGLFFIGPMAAFSFGPLSRFVAGSRYAAITLSRHLRTRTRRAHVSVSRPAPLPATVGR
jgi:thioredoxin reductase